MGIIREEKGKPKQFRHREMDMEWHQLCPYFNRIHHPDLSYYKLVTPGVVKVRKIFPKMTRMMCLPKYTDSKTLDSWEEPDNTLTSDLCLRDP